jgi:hypothetical protein
MNSMKRVVLKGLTMYGAFAAFFATSLPSAATALSVRDCGAKGDGVSDDTDAFTRAFSSSRIVSVPPGRYVVGDLLGRSNLVLKGAGEASVLIQKRSSQYLFSVNPGRNGTENAEENIHDISLEDISFHGQVQELGFAEHCHLLNINACTRLTTTRCSFRAFRGDAIYLGSGNVAGVERHNRDIHIRRCIFDGVNAQNRNAISVIDCEGLSILECRFENCSRSDMPGAIDIEPNEFPFHRIRRALISHNRLARCSGGVGNICLVLSRSKMLYPPSDITIESNFIDGNSVSNGFALLGADGSSVSGLAISGNTVRNTRSPLLLEHVDDVAIVKNVFEKSQRGGVISPSASRSGGSVRIYGNMFRSLGLKTGEGLRILGCCATDIEGNVFQDCGYAEKAGGSALRLENRGRLPEIKNNQFLNSANFRRTAIDLEGFDKPATQHALLRANTFAATIRPLR